MKTGMKRATPTPKPCQRNKRAIGARTTCSILCELVVFGLIGFTVTMAVTVLLSAFASDYTNCMYNFP
uniref:ATP-dependent Clp protease proteolytic subunit n=1 Tax=Steinernema glaseri TaxID=37863 RepID=A0A1I7YCK6_9BILA